MPQPATGKKTKAKNGVGKKALLRKKRRLRAYALLSAAFCLALILRLWGASGRPAPADAVAYAPTAAPLPAATPTPAPATAAPTATPQPTPSPADILAARAAYRPEAEYGWLPVFKRSETPDKVICITVDDCFNSIYLKNIVDKAIECGGKITIFPIGRQAQRPEVAAVIKQAWEAGFEIENHTLTHNGLYNADDETLASEVTRQNYIVSQALGVDYTCHFLRPMGGDARDDQHIHAYLSQQGYYGVAYWSISGSGATLGQLKSSLRGGDIYLFHSTKQDRDKLVKFIPYAIEQGYELVTMNELFGYEKNAALPLTREIDPDNDPVPPLEPYEVIPVDS